uniref:Sulfotransferase domain-containing protein n=1 Tax=Amblyomma maculatum TaxID=34609 RepID=G3MM44_AMBMU
MDIANYRDVDGVWMHNFFEADKIRLAMNYKPRPGEIFLVSFPKCGTTWTQHIVCNILMRAEPPSDDGGFDSMTQFLEWTGGTSKEAAARNGPAVSHLPPAGLRPVAHAKYIYVARNPYDVAVSYYHFLKGLTPKEITDVSFERFLTLFTTGKLLYGDYLDHIVPWYERRNDSNVLFLTYEELKKNFKEQVLKIADFLGKEHGEVLRQDETLFKKILDACSFESMRNIVRVTPFQRAGQIAQMAQGTTGQQLTPPPMFPEMHEGSRFVRKGVVGDWKNYFTPQLIKIAKDWIAEKTRGSNVMSLWANCDLP